MSEELETQKMLANFLKLVFMTLSQGKPVSQALKQQVERVIADLKSGQMGEQQYNRFVISLIEELDEPMIIWKLLQLTRVSHLMERGPVMLSLLASPNFQQCLTQLMRITPLMLPPSYRIDMAEDANGVWIIAYEKEDGTLLPYIKQEVVICTLLFIIREFCSGTEDLEEIRFPHSRPRPDLNIVRQVTQARIHYHEGPAMAYISRQLLNHPNAFYDEALHVSLVQQMESRLKRITKAPSHSQQIHEVLSRIAAPASATIEQIASLLHTSKSTLQRRLNTEQTSFKQIQTSYLNELILNEMLHTDTKIDALALKLGYSDRSSLERSFRNSFGFTPSRVRSLVNDFALKSPSLTLEEIAKDIHPLPKSCRSLLEEKAQNLPLSKLVSIVSEDPIFSARVMGLASKAIYGGTPKTLDVAIGRNLGIEFVIQLAVLHGAATTLEAYMNKSVEYFVHQMAQAPLLHKTLIRNLPTSKSIDRALSDQVILFGLLGILLLLHRQHNASDRVDALMKESSDLAEFIEQLNQELQLSFFGTTIVLLTHWGLGSDVIKRINDLEKNGLYHDEGRDVGLVLDLCFCLGNNKPCTDTHLEIAETMGINDLPALVNQVAG